MAKQKGMKKKHRIRNSIENIILLIAIAVFCFAAYKIISSQLEYKQANDEYDKLNTAYVKIEAAPEIVEIDGEEVMENPIDFAGLEAENSDIVAWIEIGAIEASYPVMQAEDNDFYLHRTFEKVYNFAGCIFLDYNNKADFTDKNTIIYGHNMKNGSMFGNLKKFKEEGVYESNPYIWVYTKDYIYKYEIYACQEISVNKRLPINLASNRRFMEYVRESLENSDIDTKVTVDKDDRVISLYTCTTNSSSRFIVNAKLVEQYKSKN